MSGGLTDPVALLHDLLDRYERGGGSRTATARIDESRFRNIAEWDAFLAFLASVERAGGIQLVRVKREGIEHIRTLRLADAGTVYAALGRIPAEAHAATAMAPVQQASRGSAFEAVIAQIETAWSRRRSLFGIAPGQSKRLEKAVRLARALQHRSQTAEPQQVDFRSFSRAAAGDSKALAGSIQVVAALLKASDPRLADLDPESVVALHGVERLPSPVLISGAIVFDGVAMPQAPYLGFPGDVAKRLSLSAPPRYLLTIENYASFVRHARERNPGDACLALYTGGFPSRAVLSVLTHLAKQSEAPIFHWGDMDPGGLRIFRTIEMALQAEGHALHPHMMTADLLATYGRPDFHRRRLAMGAASGSAIASLWDEMACMETLLEFEQEGLAPTSPFSSETTQRV